MRSSLLPLLRLQQCRTTNPTSERNELQHHEGATEFFKVVRSFKLEQLFTMHLDYSYESIEEVKRKLSIDKATDAQCSLILPKQYYEHNSFS